MRKLVLGLAVLAFACSIAFAQVVSSPGHGSGDPAHYNEAHTWVAIEAPLPGQVEFEIPQALFILDPAHVVPLNSLTINIRVRNNSDRAINVSDEGFAADLHALGFSSISVSTISNLAPNGTAWLTYNITMPNSEDMNSLVEDALAGNLPIVSGGGGYDATTGRLRVVTKIKATGVNPTADTTATFDFP